ncbi:N-acetylglucosamine-6-phosphate deacetylase [Jeotgalibacillus sp. S-D1]|uniref:N-acetylglucosamine-6-phosphate deacetylase n=1 Tax=Jeotgalibacillus sp. S-D1 TaxID=2552189 RepID=UPI0010592823|nr:N-acetylglucosamine-6-phosphate deacetylase [Jeotgalibacillus sp. S-D1]TDL31039.1 N-acetylglucosamine-6-phosphate deacetylase [Jeotgalibacillus sp. S-D1]
MTQSMMIKQILIHTGIGTSFRGDVFIEKGKIKKVAPALTEKAEKIIDAAGRDWSLLPGFIDLHIHGAAGHDAMDATPEALHGIAAALPKEGTTSFLATTMTQHKEAISSALQQAGAFDGAAGEAELLGVHLEGPFISPERAGAQPVEHIIPPSIDQFDAWQRQSRQSIRLITLAPETMNGFECIKELAKRNIVVSIGHSDASYDQVNEAIQHGVRHVTHLYNQMRPFHHREPGVVGAALLEDALSVEIIADFIHSHKQAVKMAYRQKGAEKIILITDAMRAKGLPAGTYDLGGQQVSVTSDDARLADGTLAGSILTMEDAVKNMQMITGCSHSELIAMTSANAARQLGIYDRKGSIEENKDADLVILDQNQSVQLTICRGHIAFQKEDNR